MSQEVPGFNATLEKIQQYGILEEDTSKIGERLELAVVDVASRNVAPDLGLTDTVSGFLTQLKAALHNELCDSENRALKAEYTDLINTGLTANGVQAVAAVVTKVVAAINPTFLVSSVVVYASIWLLKIGLNYWCSLPQRDAAH